MRFQITGEVTGLSFPLTVRPVAGEPVVLSAVRPVLHLSAHPGRLQQVEIVGWGRLWLPATAGRETMVQEHPCCGLAVADPGPGDGPRVICPQTPEGVPCPPGQEIGDPGCSCPEGSQALHPSPAEDPICGPAGRCVPHAGVRLVRGPEAPAGLMAELDGDLCLEASSAAHPTVFRPVSASPGSLLRIRVASGPGCAVLEGTETAHVALSPGRRYTVEIDHAGVQSVVVDR